MLTKKKRWGELSLNGKIMIWIAGILLVLLLSTGISFFVGQHIFYEFNALIEDNVACYEVQEAIDAEKKAFENYVREASLTNQNNYQYACAVTQQSMDALPFDYASIGRVRYARTWNLVHSYQNYTTFRDSFIQMDTSADNYIDTMYRVMDMQDYLADYALRLVQATLESCTTAYNQKANLFAILPLIFVLLLIVAVVMVLQIMHRLSATVVRPLIHMAEASRKITDNDFSGDDLVSESLDEVGELICAFNRMKHAMAEHLETLAMLHSQEIERLSLEKNLNQTRLEVLKSQVNPHFLFNTLNMISCTARMEDAHTTDHMIVSLGNLFRYNLRTKKQVVPLEQELEMLEDYIYLQSMRYNNRITCKKIIQVDAATVRIPSFLLQPVVENAFTHGLRSKLSGGRIVLRIWQERNVLMVSIMDNGRGMKPEDLELLMQKLLESEATGEGIGLGNIYRRVTMLYPNGGMRIYSKEGRGTVVQFLIPQNEPLNLEGDCYEI